MTRGPASPGPVRLTLPGRSLVLLAGVPGAGKSTLLAGLPAGPDVALLDSQTHRDALARRLPAGTPYRRYRLLVHLLHRLAIVRAAALGPSVVLVHLPATSVACRQMVALLAALTGRSAHLVWLDVEAADALQGQAARGRVVPSASFAAHAGRAAGLAESFRAHGPPPGWSDVTVLDRAGARLGLGLDVSTGPRDVPATRQVGS
ncbi:AAA family ATPase [Pseudonocardia asaccharolytica]|uniref:ATP-binding protein n=1 Tax=Pseudonocardia asaccharolytica DSM 44247 = NBRC 16224 TaxID=1123024 RepID=A0A511CYX0_9PSEU|nr:AAA family ATPase [Pseudonocardia asaccharolytica]GEL17759.1 ATP-binding protein [Pseudonocardia asaccharolytica DSM 44247 = NBRC 16224]